MNPNDTPKIHVHTSDDGPCGHCSGNDCPMRYCPGCPPGCALAEDEPGGAASDVRSVSPARGPECPKSVAPCHSGVTHSPSRYPSDPPPLNGPQNRAERCEPVDVTEAEMLKFVAACDGPQGVSADELVLLDGIRGTVEAATALVALADRLSDKVDRLTAERDRARGLAVALEAELARLREGIEAMRHYCGCAWCCTGSPREQRGQGHAGCAP